MSGDRGVELSPEEIDAFLGRGGTAVLSLARGDEPYSTPVSYGYVADSRRFFLRLGVGPEGGKGPFVESDGAARLVAYRRVDGGWTSVIASGRLRRVDPDDLTAETARALRDAELPLLAIWGDDLEDVEFRVFRLDPDELTGRTTAPG